MNPDLARSAPTSGIVTTSWSVPLLAFLTILLDGFDTTSIGFVVPTLAREWKLPPAAFTAAFVTTSLGAVVGYILSGYAASRYGRRGVILASVAVFAAGSCVTALVTSVAPLALLRLVTGIGLGAALPACISLAVEYGPGHRREVMSVAVTSGMAMGATLGGALGGALIAKLGWPAVFWLGGVLPTALLPFLWVGLPADRPQANLNRLQPSAESGVRSLLAPGLRMRTALLWSFAFLVFTATYVLVYWTPTLLLSFGFELDKAPLGGAAMGVGGLVAALLLVPLTAWRGIRPILIVTTLGAVVMVVTLARWPLAGASVLGVIAMLGGCLIAGTLGQSALAVSLYGSASRTAGIGWAAAMGRLGSIVGPAVGGLLLSLGHTPRDVLLTLCVPILASVVVLILLGRAKGE